MLGNFICSNKKPKKKICQLLKEPLHAESDWIKEILNSDGPKFDPSCPFGSLNELQSLNDADKSQNPKISMGRDKKSERIEKIAINVSLMLNIILFGIKLYIVIITNSLAVVASLIDSMYL